MTPSPLRLWPLLVALVGLGLLIVGHYMALAVVPPERMMGEVARILYVHVPAAWMALVAFTLAFAGALGFVLTGRLGFDWLVEAAVEAGVVLNVLLLLLGSIFARPTWGTWWTWDPRLTSSAIMLLTFVGVMLLRTLVEEPRRRALWSAVATILAYVNIPVTYFSVKWWRSMHQIQSSPETFSDQYTLVLRINAFAFLFLLIAFLAWRWRIAAARAELEAPPPLPEGVTT